MTITESVFINPFISHFSIKKNALQGAFSFHILFTALFHGSFHKTVEEGVGPVRAALEFRMGLGGGKVGMIF